MLKRYILKIIDEWYRKKLLNDIERCEAQVNRLPKNVSKYINEYLRDAYLQKELETKDTEILEEELIYLEAYFSVALARLL